VYSPEHRRSPVRVGQMLRRGLLAGRTRRIEDANRAHHCRCRTNDRGEQQRRTDAVTVRDPRNHQSAQSHSQRLRGLADAHRQSAALRREPADHQTTARRVAAGRRHAAKQQECAGQHQRRRCRGRESRRGRQRGTEREHDPLAVAVCQVAPGDQREDHADARHRREQPRLRQAQLVALMQRRNQERRAVDEHIREQRGQQRDCEH